MRRRRTTAAREGTRGDLSLRLFRLLPARLFHHLRTTPHVGDATLRAIDRLLPHHGFVVKRIRAGPLKGLTLEVDPRALDVVIGRYETAAQEVIAEFLHEGDLAFDIGAHLGFYTLTMASAVGRDGRVVSFEPDPVIMSGLRRNIERNRAYVGGRAVPVEAAVGATTGRAAFARGPRTTRGRIASGPGDFEVEMVTLDDAAERYGAPALVKIDVEGAEVEVLGGGTRVLERVKPALLIEAHSPVLEAECTALLARFGYDCRGLPAPDRRESYILAS